MSRTNIENAELYNPLIKKAFKMGITTLPGTANASIAVDMGPVIQMVPTAARTLTLPAVTPDMKGLAYFIQSGAAFALTVNNASAAAITTVASNTSSIVVCTGDPAVSGGWIGG